MLNSMLVWTSILPRVAPLEIWRMVATLIYMIPTFTPVTATLVAMPPSTPLMATWTSKIPTSMPMPRAITMRAQLISMPVMARYIYMMPTFTRQATWTSPATEPTTKRGSILKMLTLKPVTTTPSAAISTWMPPMMRCICTIWIFTRIPRTVQPEAISISMLKMATYIYMMPTFMPMRTSA